MTGIGKSLVLCIAASLLCFGCSSRENYAEIQDIAEQFPIEAEPESENPQDAVLSGPRAVLYTTAGEITIQLYPRLAPKTVENFIDLAKEGYYNGSNFFYVKRGELAQTGKPEKGAEKSSFGGSFTEDPDNGLYHYRGAVGMAGGLENQDLSQFYLLVQNAVPEDGRIVPATLYMNELIRMRSLELNERNKESLMSEEEIQEFEAALNQEIQQIGKDGIPEAFQAQYAPVAEQYEKFGGAWNLDGKYTVFGQITKGLNVAEAITQVKVEAETRQPKKDVVIERIEILD